MMLITLLLINIRIIDIIDILLFSFLLYHIYNLIKGTVAVNILIGILSICFMWLLVAELEMLLLTKVLGLFLSGGAVALIIVFQQELRRFLLLIGTNGFLGDTAMARRFISWKWKSDTPKSSMDVGAIVKACANMSQNKIGALMVIARQSDVGSYIKTGEILNATLTASLIESIFFKNSPLHDGAVIISDNLIIAARCILPLTHKTDIPHYLGLRHRAALGASEDTDAIVIVVSEQFGTISYFKEGGIYLDIDAERLSELLEKDFVKE
jgi:uncharacterized protein (TIGR00159 family)